MNLQGLVVELLLRGDIMRYALPRKYKNISRYNIYRQIIDEQNDTYLETVNSTPIDNSSKDIYHEVLMEEENRLDIIADKYYGNASYWWILAMGNDFVDPFYVKAGTIIRIPDFFSTMKWGSALFGRV